MRRSRLVATVLLGLSTSIGAPARAAEGLAEDVDQAATIIEKFREIPESAVPDHVMKDAKGLAILTVLKAGFIVSGQGGKGLVIARTTKGWSGPSAIGTGGAGVGFQAGAQVSEFVIVLNTAEAVKAFSRGGNLKLGADLSVAAGPIGRNLSAGVTPIAAVYSYSRSQGLFAGVSLDGMVIATRTDANTEYYGKPVTPDEILDGKISPPAGAQKLIKELGRY